MESFEKIEISRSEKKNSLLNSFLEDATFASLYDSWLKLLNENSEIKGEIALLFPDGVSSLIDVWFSLADKEVETAIISKPELKIREKAVLAVKTRLEYLGQNKEALRKALAWLALPVHLNRGIEIGLRFSNVAWRAFGDKSTDFNYYSKRAILLGVDVATALVFLSDESENHQNSWAFLERRIENVMQFEKFKFKVRDFAQKLPSPLPFLTRLRYGK